MILSSRLSWGGHSQLTSRPPAPILLLLPPALASFPHLLLLLILESEGRLDAAPFVQEASSHVDIHNIPGAGREQEEPEVEQKEYDEEQEEQEDKEEEWEVQVKQDERRNRRNERK